ncbi:hypothetical protein J3R74_003526 [Puniceicoccus vermicola]
MPEEIPDDRVTEKSVGTSNFQGLMVAVLGGIKAAQGANFRCGEPEYPEFS